MTTPPSLATADMKELRRLLDEADATEWRVTDAIGGYGDIIALVRHSFLEPVCCQPFEEKIIGSFEDDNNSRLACLAHKLAPSLLAEREAREGRIERLIKEAKAMLTAIKFSEPPVDFGTPDDPNLCYECRIPTGFSTNLEAALLALAEASHGK